MQPTRPRPSRRRPVSGQWTRCTSGVNPEEAASCLRFQMTHRSKGLCRLAVAAERLGVSVRTLRRRISDGTLRGYRVGRLIRVDANELTVRLLVEIPSVK